VGLRAQYAAVAAMRWQMLLHSLRTGRGSFELGARLLSQGFFALIGLGIGLGLGFGAFQITAHDSPRMLAAIFWPVLIFWQVVPITIASFQENADLSIFLRFPLNFPSYALFYILFGLFDIGSIVGGIALAGIWVGASIARPDLAGWITVAVVLFAAFNVLLTRMIFSWIDRWLAQRKTREILGVVFLFLIMGVQFLNPVYYQNRNHGSEVTQASIVQRFHSVARAQRYLPPGLAATAVNAAHEGKPLAAGADLLFLALYAAVAGALLGIRLRAEYRGENLGEAPRKSLKAAPARPRRAIEGRGPVAAVVEKEIRYLMRSGILLYASLAPLIIVFLFSRGMPGGGGGGEFAREYALPFGVAYSFLGLTRFIYNNLGGEGAGVQLYFLSPTPFRKVMLGKNIVHTLIFVVELVLVSIIVAYRAGMPSAEILAVTLAWLLFAVPAQLAMGNVLSITMAYRMNMARMAREPGSLGNSLLSLVVQGLVFGVGAAVYVPLNASGHSGLAVPVLLALAVGSFWLWQWTLARAAGMVASQKESLVATLYKAA
jgi:ABC-2 type transport system permease protein